jgi:2,3-bisphosphoglycerate-dependent phosphoglycerate mutase
MEYNNGVLAGLSYEEAAHILKPKELHIPIEGGESTIEFRMRIEMIFSRIVSEGCLGGSSSDVSGSYNRIAIVAHGGVINNILRSFFKLPINREFHFKNGDTALHLIEITDTERTVHFLNDTSHLD